ncbi:hypothetical protein AMJ49_00500 [Parcubacteria bacterium DG_74_2]|nr:MAG: hypothetical protein AMJ49_00500 [Parcubacteria bacterium DG_74_2]
MNVSYLIIKNLLKSRIENEADLASFKRKVAKKYKISCPSNIELLKAYHKLLKERRVKKSENIEKILKTRPIRSLSGIVNISVLTKPYSCPGKCVFCPLEKGIPKSYLSGEPAVERAKGLKYDPYLQIEKRIEMLELEGHPTDKIELRIVGGTWSFYPRNYQNWFIKRCFEACNKKTTTHPPLSHRRRAPGKSLKDAQILNEKAKNRIVGLSIETRPDFINKKEIFRLRNLGVTMVEIGVQTVFDDVLKINKTNLNQNKIIQATKLLKDAGFKVLYHLMLNLPGSDFKKDLECFQVVFEDKRFKPDWIKIYPVVVTKGSELYEIWKKGKYKPYSEKKLIELLVQIKKILPYWVRVARILRDIPVPKIEAGCKISNLREVVKREIEKRDLLCKCIRCREIKGKYDQREKVYLFREDYDASNGREIFLSFENKKRNKLYSLLRLRIPSQVFKKERYFIPVLKISAIIREIQTYGELVPIAEKKLAPQHRGLGKKLIKEAEKIAKKELKLKKISIIAGIGTREYFRKFGYKLKKTYMIKFLK